MLIEIFSLCDAATSENGKLNILGAFDTIWSKEFPLVFSRCTLALRARFSAIEKGTHKVSVRFINADGKNVLPPAGGEIQINPPEPQQGVSSNVVLNIHSLKLDTPGEYSLELNIDGHNIMSLPIFAKQIEP